MTAFLLPRFMFLRFMFLRFMLLHAAGAGAGAGHLATSGDLLHRWGGDPGALVSITLLALLYGIGVRRLWNMRGRYHVVSLGETAAFYGAILTLLIALCSPIDALADTLFSAHMLQHMLLIVVAAPLTVLGAPLLPLMWSLPRAVRVRTGRTWNRIGMRRGGAALVSPLPAWGLHTVALWAWHIPAAYAAALSSAPIHALEHISFYATATLVWWTALRPLRGHLGAGGSLAVLAGTLAQSSALGAILTFSGTPWYLSQSAGAAAWNLSALQDQQLAGLIMWIPAGLFYVVAILAVMRRILDAPARSAAVATAIMTASVSACAGNTPSRTVTGGNPLLGKVAIEHYGCGACHAIPGIPTATGAVGPPLAGIAGRRMIAGIVANTPDEMVRWIVMPQSMSPGNAMPDLGISDGQARDIAAYLYTLH